LVSSADCTELEIADAAAREDLLVDPATGLGYVCRLPGWLKQHDPHAR
jgi:hypothetical protein